MPTQVFIRRKQAGRDNVLELAEVLAEKQGGDVLRLKITGIATPMDVKKSDTVPVSVVAPGQARLGGRQAVRPPEKCYPTSRGALANTIY
jgi:hypothetical protein